MGRSLKSARQHQHSYPSSSSSPSPPSSSLVVRTPPPQRRRGSCAPCPSRRHGARSSRRMPYVRHLPLTSGASSSNTSRSSSPKPFIGCAGDFRRCGSPSPRACLLILNRKDRLLSEAEQVVYPGAFVVERLRASPRASCRSSASAPGIVDAGPGRDLVGGRSKVRPSIATAQRRRHEFAHQLDQRRVRQRRA